MAIFTLRNGQSLQWEPTTALCCSCCREPIDRATIRQRTMDCVNFTFDFDPRPGGSLAQGEYWYLHKRCADVEDFLFQQGVKIQWGWCSMAYVLGLDRVMMATFGNLPKILRTQMPPGTYDRLVSEWLPGRRLTSPFAPSVPSGKPGYVYLIEAVGAGRIKIGHGANVEQRLHQLRTGTPYPLRVLHRIPTQNSLALEQRLHARYHAYKIHNEWFALPQDVLQALLEEVFPA